MCTLIFLRDIYRHMHLGLDVRSVLSLIVKTGVNGSPVRLGKIRLAVQSVTKRSTNRMSTLLRRLCLNRSSEQIQCQTLVPWAQVNRFSACRVMSGVLRQLKDKDLCLGCHCTKPINFLRCTPCTQVRFNGFCWTTTVSSIGETRGTVTGPEGNLSKFPGRVTPMRGQDHWKLKDAQNFDCDTRAFRPKLQRSELKKKYSLRPQICAGKKLAEEQELSSRQ